MELFGLVAWLGLAVIVGVAANTRGRHGVGWFILAVVLSPLLVGLLLLVLPRKEKRLPGETWAGGLFGLLPKEREAMPVSLMTDTAAADRRGCQHPSAGVPTRASPAGVARAVIRRWQLIIVTPVLIIVLVLSALGVLVSQPPICTNCGGLLTNTPKIFGFVAFCFLPFFVLAAWVKPTFVKYGSDTKPAHAAIIGGLLGVLIAYALFAYAGFLLGFGVFWIFFLFWLGGLVLALLGLKVGPKFVRHASGA